MFIGLDNSGYQVVFLFLKENMMGYSLEAPRRGASNEYPQRMFSLRNRKKYRYFLVEKSALSRAMITLHVGLWWWKGLLFLQ